MSRRRFTDPEALLHDLVDRYEARPGAARLVAYLDEAGFVSAREQDACLERLGVVERKGGILIDWRRVDGVDQVRSVRLVDPERIYAHLGRVPAPRRAADALRVLRRRSDAPAQLDKVLDDVAQAWSRNVRRFGLAPGRSNALAAALNLSIALLARTAEAEAPQIDYRSFSRASVGDSKALERLAPTITQLLRRLAPAEVKPEAVTPAEVLAGFGVVRLPQPLMLGGPLTLDGLAIPSMPYLGLPPEEASRVGVLRAPAYTLIVENFTSFVRHVREVNGAGDGLVIFSGGFPSRQGRKAIVALAAAAKAPVLHWGDIDLGGVRVFLHLEQAFCDRGVRLKPHLMDPSTLKAYGARSCRGRNSAVSVPDASAIAPLWRAMNSDLGGYELEQEALAPQRPAAL